MGNSSGNCYVVGVFVKISRICNGDQIRIMLGAENENKKYRTA